MSIEEIRTSGLIEEYALGLLDKREAEKIASYIVQYPELRTDYEDYQRTLEMYAKIKRVAPREGLKEKILDSIKKNNEDTKGNSSGTKSKPKSGGGWWTISSVMLGLVAGGMLLKLNSVQSAYVGLQEKYQNTVAQCDSVNHVQQSRISTYDSALGADAKGIAIQATEKYPDAVIIFRTNTKLRKNYLDILNLPKLEDGETFQLWSLKNGEDPIPLNIFIGNDKKLIPVDYENDTITYAITIEPAGGSTSPNLANLIGTFGV